MKWACAYQFWLIHLGCILSKKKKIERIKTYPSAAKAEKYSFPTSPCNNWISCNSNHWKAVMKLRYNPLPVSVDSQSKFTDFQEINLHKYGESIELCLCLSTCVPVRIATSLRIQISGPSRATESEMLILGTLHCFHTL